MSSSEATGQAVIPAVRRFNRFYTQRIGVLDEGLDQSPFTLPEARILFELAQAPNRTATELARQLGLDPGYLSRLLGGLTRRGRVRRTRSKTDARHGILALTPAGLKAFQSLEARTNRNIGGMIEPLSAEGRRRLTASMGEIERLLEPGAEAVPYLLRGHAPGDMGWVVQSHGELYAREYHWNGEFEALVAEIVARFLRDFDPRWERCWIAERDGLRVGSVFVVRHSAQVAQLRLLLVDPSVRGLGIGQRLVQECIRFAREAGYRRMSLWTNDVLHSARRIYQKEGFDLVSSEAHHSFGHDLVSQTWEREL